MAFPQAFYLRAAGSETGHRFCLFHPAAGESVRGSVLYIHPFAEEMNKARRMAALQARALAEAGYAVLQIDLLGCGDSSGDFGDASWAAWIEDVLLGVRWLRSRSAAPLWLWGLRAGCLLAAEAARRLDTPCHFLFWAPPASGRLVLQQFLRLKTAGGLLDGDARAAVDEVRRLRAAGLPVEVAGYALAPALATGLENATLRPPAAAGMEAAFAGTAALEPRLAWIELSSRDPAALSPASQALLAAWRQAGFRVQGETVRGPAFWQTAEIEDAPGLIATSLAALGACGAPPAAAASACEGTGSCRDAIAAPAGCGEEALLFGCTGETLLGILHRPAIAGSDTAVLVLVGGPQYRAGSHRQFVLLARRLAGAGHPVLRFDFGGMGDSSGGLRGFEDVGDDIRAAIDALQRRLPAVRRVVLWGLCDGASAALLYCHAAPDARVQGAVVLNPWVRTPATEARTLLKHYYTERVRQPEFWRKLLSRRVAAGAVNELLHKVRAANAPGRPADGEAPFLQRMALGWKTLEGRLLLVLSGEDYTAREFLELAARDEAWCANLRHPRLVRHDLPGADHTFSAPGSREAVERLTLDWLASVPAPVDAIAVCKP